MLLTSDFEKHLLLDPARIDGKACNKLRIVTGYMDCDRISSHLIALKDGLTKDNKIYTSGITIEIILGMYKGNGLPKKKHNDICRTIDRLRKTRGMPKITCRYISTGQEVHSKVYVWLVGNTPSVAFCGSVNYTTNAFQRRRECTSSCDPFDANEYYKSLLPDTVDCFDPLIESIMHFPDTPSVGDERDTDDLDNVTYEQFSGRESIDTISISLLTTKGDVGHGSGINWGIRPNGLARNRNQAYIPYNRKDRKPDFFPGRINPDDKNCPLFKVVTKDAGSFYMRLAQDKDKGIHSAESNAIIGKWIRDKIGANDGEFITKKMLENYGTTRVVFKKFSDDLYVLEFEPDSE